MEAKLGFWLMTVWLSSALAADIEEFFTVGDSLELRPPEKPTVPITRVVWKYNGNLLADWDGGAVDYYGQFKGRTNLTTSNGHLIIRNMETSDEGNYGVEINSKEQSTRYNVRQKVLIITPEVLFRPLGCGSASPSNCSLACVASTSNKYPITYKWKKGGGQWEDINSETIEFINDAKTYTCKMKNRFNEKESNPYENPFFIEKQEGSNAGLAAGLIVLFIIIIVAVLAYWKRDYLRRMIRGNEGASKEGNEGARKGGNEGASNRGNDGASNGAKPEENNQNETSGLMQGKDSGSAGSAVAAAEE